jgi:hypothetical protein
MKKRKRLPEVTFEAKLQRLVNLWLEPQGGRADTFADQGVLTCNKGLVVTLPGGQEFQLTIVDSSRR